jgi:hypothetical protein
MQTASLFAGAVFSMAYPIRILTSKLDGEDGLIVTFSDGTCGAYVVEELLDLRPHREPTKAQHLPN